MTAALVLCLVAKPTSLPKPPYGAQVMSKTCVKAVDSRHHKVLYVS